MSHLPFYLFFFFKENIDLEGSTRPFAGEAGEGNDEADDDDIASFQIRDISTMHG